MVRYTLYYFPVRNRAEPIRQLFKIAGIKFEERAITMEEWPQYKSQMPLGQMPVLDVDGVKLGQTASILRFLGHQFKRAGRDVIECAKLDMVAELMQEMFQEEAMKGWIGIIIGFVPGDKDSYFAEKVQAVVDKYAPQIERFLLENGRNGLVFGDKESWVDIFVSDSFSRFEDYGAKTSLSAYPLIKEMINRVQHSPAIKHHIALRPETIC